MIARWLLVLAALGALAAAVAACTLLEDDLPAPRACERAADCFAGERCDLSTKTCLALDAGSQ